MEDRPKLLSPSLSQINLMVSFLNKALKRHMDLFDYWVEHRTLNLFSEIIYIKSLEFVAGLEQCILIWTECDTIAAALLRRAFVKVQLKEALLLELLKQRKSNFDGLSKTAFDDAVVLNHLEQNLVLLSS